MIFLWPKVCCSFYCRDFSIFSSNQQILWRFFWISQLSGSVQLLLPLYVWTNHSSAYSYELISLQFCPVLWLVRHKHWPISIEDTSEPRTFCRLCENVWKLVSTDWRVKRISFSTGSHLFWRKNKRRKKKIDLNICKRNIEQYVVRWWHTLGHKGPALPAQAQVEVGHSVGLGLPSPPLLQLLHHSP